jgi:hypothetical protein
MLAALAIAATLAGCSSTTSSAPATTTQPAVETPAPAAPEPPKDPTADWTVSQRNAVRKAESYLEHMAFSRSGLIEQLEYEKYSTEDATFAVDHVKVDWNAQAAKKAKSYLETMPFSREGLLSQLEYEGYTPEQAEHGVNSVGL